MRKSLGGLLGMTEQEIAVEVMLEKAEEKGIPMTMVTVWPGDFVKRPGALVGFCHLCCRDLVRPAYPNSEFHPTLFLIGVMRKHHPEFADLPDPPDWIQVLIDKTTKIFEGHGNCGELSADVPSVVVGSEG